MVGFALFALLMSSVISSSSSHQDTILDAKNRGKYDAIVSWNGHGFTCSSIDQFNQVIKREILTECELQYAHQYFLRSSTSNSIVDQLISACKVGANEILHEKENLCHHNYDCEESGIILAGPVTAILCQYIHSPWSVQPIPSSCSQRTEASCVETVIANIQAKIEDQECQNALPILERKELHKETMHLCDSFIHAYSYVQPFRFEHEN